MNKALEQGAYPNLHSLLISIKGELIYENYFKGSDQLFGKDIGTIEMTNDYIHDTRSISKIVVAACIGIAIDQGKIKGINQSILDYFPSKTKGIDTIWSRLTIGHLLTMTSGIVWNEPALFTDPTNSELLMINCASPIDFIFNSQIDQEPGSLWRYNGGNYQLLAEIIKCSSEMPIDEFARKYLFRKLEIDEFEWIRCPGSKLPAAASGLRLKSIDLLKIGQTFIDQGRWKNQQVIPAKWACDSIRTQVNRSDTEGFGYGFWIWDELIQGIKTSFCVAPGNGDQRIYIDNNRQLVVVVTAGNYDKWDMVNNSLGLMKKFIIPAINTC